MRYGAAVAFVALAVPLTIALQRLMGAPQTRIPFALFFGVVMLATWFGGRGPGLVSAFLSALVSAYFFLPPSYSLKIGFEGLVQVSVFLLVSLLISSLMERSRRAEEAVSANEKWLFTTLNSIGDAVIATDAEGRVTLMNPTAQQLTGWREAEAKGRQLSEVFRIVNEETRAEVESPVAKVIREGRVVGMANHTVLLSKDGREIPIDDSGAPIVSDDGRLSGVALVFHDVTSRRHTEALVRANERRLGLIFNSVSDSLFLLRVEDDDCFRFVSVNEEFMRDRGLREDEIVGKRIEEVLPESSHALIKGKYSEAVRENRTVSWEEVADSPSGKRIGQVSVTPLPDEAEGRVMLVGSVHDLTDSRQVEEQRLKLAAIVESSDDAILSKTLEGIITSWNEGAQRMYGYTPEEVVGRHVSLLVAENHADEIDEILACLKRGERIEHRESMRVRKDGTPLHVSLTISPIKNAGGQIIGASTIARNITERKRNEAERERLLEREQAARAEIEESQQRYRYLADSMPQIVWTARADGWNDYYNRRWFDYTGMTPEQTEGWGWQPVLHPDDVERCLRRWARSVQTGEDFEIEYRFRRGADGMFRWHLGRAKPMRDAEGKIVKWFGTATDIEDQKRTEEALRFLSEADAILASSLDFELTLETVARLAVPRVADYCLVDLIDENREIGRMIVAHSDPAKEHAWREMQRRFPLDPNLPHSIPKVLRTGEPELYADMTDEMLDAALADVEQIETLRQFGIKSSMIVPLLARGRTIGAISFIAAESNRRYNPSDLALAEDLARRAALAIDNSRLYRRIEEANRAKDEFLATLSHELRTPLTPVIGWVHMLRHGRLPESETPHGLAVIDKNAQMLARLINDLLDMSAILSGKMRIEHMPVELDTVLHEAIEAVRTSADGRKVALDIEFEPCGDGDAPPTPRTVLGDRMRLVQVFGNLLNNAIKFSNGGDRVRVVCRSDGAQARVEIADEGQGIPQEFLPYVFDRFRQADGSTTRSHGGLGIGLALVKSFVEAHGGEAIAASAGVGRGSSFTVVLPLIPQPPAPADEQDAPAETPPVASPQATPGVLHVLIVEDARDTLDMLQAVFESRGYEVTLCETAAEALRVAPSTWFDIIISDIGLPQIDGYDLIKRLRQIPHLRLVPAVALTGYAAQKDAEAALLAGFDMHIPKPVDPNQFADALQRLIREKS
jgi:PAS domain S-box-containing protein